MCHVQCKFCTHKLGLLTGKRHMWSLFGGVASLVKIVRNQAHIQKSITLQQFTIYHNNCKLCLWSKGGLFEPVQLLVRIKGFDWWRSWEVQKHQPQHFAKLSPNMFVRRGMTTKCNYLMVQINPFDWCKSRKFHSESFLCPSLQWLRFDGLIGSSIRGGAWIEILGASQMFAHF